MKTNVICEACGAEILAEVELSNKTLHIKVTPCEACTTEAADDAVQERTEELLEEQKEKLLDALSGITVEEIPISLISGLEEKFPETMLEFVKGA